MIKKVVEYFVDNSRIRFDGDLVCLNDLYVAAKSPADKQKPAQWMRNAECATYSIKAGKQALDSNEEFNYAAGALFELRPEASSSNKRDLEKWAADCFNILEQWGLMKRREGRGGGTYAHKLIAMEYSGYLSSELRVKINETFLRAESGDVTLAAEIADKASAKDQKWLANRLKGIECRNELTSELSRHQVNGKGFGLCTDSTYKGLFGATAKELRKTRNLPVKANVRNELSSDELGTIMFAEIATRKKLEKNLDVSGNTQCADFCLDIAQKINAIISD